MFWALVVIRVQVELHKTIEPLPREPPNLAAGVSSEVVRACCGWVAYGDEVVLTVLSVDPVREADAVLGFVSTSVS